MDGLYAVYEASTLELWSFMMTSAMEGHSGETGRLFVISVFYMVLILFIVILLQVRLLLLIIYTMWIVFIIAKYIFGCYNWVICWSEESLKRKDFVIIIIIFQPKAATNKTIHSECTSCTGDLFCKGKQLFWVCSCILHVLIVSKMIELWMKWC